MAGNCSGLHTVALFECLHTELRIFDCGYRILSNAPRICLIGAAPLLLPLVKEHGSPRRLCLSLIIKIQARAQATLFGSNVRNVIERSA